MRPLRSFFLLLIFLVCFTGLHYLIHGSQFFPSLYEFVPERLVAGLSSYGATNTEPQAPINADSVINISSEIQLSVDSAVLLTEFTVDDYLMPFLDSLREGKGQIRVMYYGDSQIEGDRMTSLLRHTLRVGRRGNGPGLFLPLMPVMYTKSLWIRSSSNWERYTFLSYKGGSIQHRALGPFMAICRYLPNGIVSKEIQKATVRLKPSNGADSTVSVFDQLRVFYGNANGIVHINVSANGNSLLKDTLSRGKSFSEISCRLNGASEIEIEFSGYVSPDIYGISIESNEGIIVDNIPQRGSAGLELQWLTRII